MKTILYSIIAMLICGSLFMGFINPASINNTILIQSVDKQASSVSLTRSAEIITNRLKALSAAKFDLTVIPGKNQIKVNLEGDWDLNTVETLLTQKGKLEFYATYNHQQLSELLKGDSHLFSLMNAQDAKSTEKIVGCVPVEDRDKVNDYLKTFGLSEKCRFAWEQLPSIPKACLYALQLENQKGAPFTGADIESAHLSHLKNSNPSISMSFKKPAIPLFADFTKRNMDNAIAILLDNNVIYSPTVMSVIENGTCIFTGNPTEMQTKLLVLFINSGELPISFEVVK